MTLMETPSPIDRKPDTYQKQSLFQRKSTSFIYNYHAEIEQTYQRFYAPSTTYDHQQPINLMHIQVSQDKHYNTWQRNLIANAILNITLPEPQNTLAETNDPLRVSLKGDTVRNLHNDVVLQKRIGAVIAIERDF